MQKIQQKRPYLAPELTVVDFKVEVGQYASGVQIQDYDELNRAMMDRYGAGQLFQEMNMNGNWATGWGGYSGQASNGGYFGYGWTNGGDGAGGFWGN